MADDITTLKFNDPGGELRLALKISAAEHKQLMQDHTAKVIAAGLAALAKGGPVR